MWEDNIVDATRILTMADAEERMDSPIVHRAPTSLNATTEPRPPARETRGSTCIHNTCPEGITSALTIITELHKSTSDEKENDDAQTEVCCAVVDETINSLMNGPHSQYFSSEGDKVICTMSDGAKCEVLVSETVDLSDVSQFQPLTNWQSINALLGEDTDVPVEQKDTYTAAEMETALKYAKDTKLFPPNIKHGSDFHIDFLWHHFCRDARHDRKKGANAERWKKAIRDNLDVLDDRIGCMACEPYEFSLVPGAKPVRCRPYPLSPVKKDALAKMIDVLLKNDIIEPSTSADWNSPLLLVSKGDGR